jgi:(p)ppGpp synthase/HD superfamily hydrolase
MPDDEKLERPLSVTFNDALTYAATLHRTQARKGTQIPYVSHLLAVAGLVMEHGGDENHVIAALLHDAVEDQGGDHVGDEIRRRFGDQIFDIVMGCTDARVTPKPPWEARKRAYIDRVTTEPASIKLVSAADKLHNARAILADYRALGEKLWSRFNGGKDGTLWYYRELVKAFRQGEQTDGLRRLVDELERVVVEVYRLSGVEMADSASSHASSPSLRE